MCRSQDVSYCWAALLIRHITRPESSHGQMTAPGTVLSSQPWRLTRPFPPHCSSAVGSRHGAHCCSCSTNSSLRESGHPFRGATSEAALQGPACMVGDSSSAATESPLAAEEIVSVMRITPCAGARQTSDWTCAVSCAGQCLLAAWA